MKRGYAVLGTAILLAASIAAAGAQGRGRGMMGGGGLQMLAIPEVQQELKMTQPQIDKLQTAQTGMQEKMRTMMEEAGGPQAFQGMSPEERAKLFTKMQDAQTAAVKEILDQKQL